MINTTAEENVLIAFRRGYNTALNDLNELSDKVYNDSLNSMIDSLDELDLDDTLYNKIETIIQEGLAFTLFDIKHSFIYKKLPED